jgi:hypothetical protein
MNRLFREYHFGDFDFIDPIGAVAEDHRSLEHARWWVEQSHPDRSRTVLDVQGRPIAVTNANMISQGVLELYSFVDKRVEECAIRYGRGMRAVLADVLKTHPGVHRVQMLVRADQPWAGRWASFLEMNFEGRLRSYGAQGEDHFLYAKVRE